MFMSFQKFTQALRNVGVVVSDVYFNLVTLLLNTTSTNGAQNNTFLDSSNNTYTITRFGNTTQGTFSPFSQTGWSANFDGSTAYLTAADTATLRFGSGNLTIEAFVYRSVSGAAQTIAAKGAATPTGWAFQINAADKLQFVDTNANITSTTSLVSGTWYYVAAVRAGTGTNQTTLYINAASDATGNSATNFNQTNNLLVGVNRSTANFANGYISNLRLSNVARTISSVPTTGLTADANTIFLATNVNRFTYTDSTSANTIMTVTGAPSVQAFSPFAPNVAYSTSTIGGSGYFNRSSDYLDVGSNANLTIGTNDFTIAMWVYFTVVDGTSQVIFDGRPSSSADNVTPTIIYSSVSNSWSYRVNGAGVITGTASVTTAGQWHYVVVSRLSGTTRLFVNGAQQGSNYADGNNYVAFASDRPRIANRGNNAGAGLDFGGYISGLQVLVGTGTSAPATPTAPPTANVTNTQLLLNYTNAGIYNATAKSDLATVGNASVSTTQAKFSPTAIAFDGTGDYISAAPVTVINSVNNADCTIEMWVYSSNSSSALKCLIDTRSALGASTGYGIYQTGNNVVVYGGPLRGNAAASLNGNTWTHLAVTRSGSNNFVFLSGTLFNTFSYGNTLTSGNVTIGADVAGSNAFTGFIEEVRITNGVARYTNNFSVPTTVFPTQ